LKPQARAPGTPAMRVVNKREHQYHILYPLHFSTSGIVTIPEFSYGLINILYSIATLTQGFQKHLQH